MTDPTPAILEYLRSNGMYDAILAHVAKGQPDAGDVHAPAANGSGKKKPTTIAVEDLGGVDDEPDVDVAKRIADADQVFAKGDAGLYVYRPLTPESANRLHTWATEIGLPNVVPAELMHVTQVHSKQAVDGLEPLSTLLDVPEQPRFLASLGDKGALVLFIGGKELHERFAAAKAAGAEWDFPFYRPHITLSYDAGPNDQWPMMDGPAFPLQLGPEVFQASNGTWVEDKGLRKQEFEFSVAVKKVDPEQQMVFGWASISSIGGVEVIDKQDEVIPVEELEKGAYEFVLYSREHGDMHAKRDTGRMIESMVFTPDKAAAGVFARDDTGAALMGWWVGFRVSDPDLWKKHKEGKRPEFSIGGHATRVER